MTSAVARRSPFTISPYLEHVHFLDTLSNWEHGMYVLFPTYEIVRLIRTAGDQNLF